MEIINDSKRSNGGRDVNIRSSKTGEFFNRFDSIH